MDGPGLSIFQGAEIKINNSLQRREEEELLEEGKKRDAELKDLFEDAFDDLNDDDDEVNSSIGSSEFSKNHSESEFQRLDGRLPEEEDQTMIEELTDVKDVSLPEEVDQALRQSEKPTKPILKNGFYHTSNPNGFKNTNSTLEHYKHCFQKGILSNEDAVSFTAYKHADAGGIEQLKALYDVRLREVDRLRRDLEVEVEAKEEALHQLALCQAEKDALLDMHARTEHHLETSQEKIVELEELINSLKGDVVKLEKAKQESENEVEIANHQLRGLQQRIAAMERTDINTNREKQLDAYIDGLNSKHQKEIAALQLKYDNLNEKYNYKEEDYKRLEEKLDELERKRSALMLEKCDSTVRQEATLQALLEEANSEKLQLNKQLITLQGECEMLKSDLKQYESVNKLKLTWGNSSSDEGELYNRMSISRPKRQGSKAQSSPHIFDLNNKLRDELHKALLGQRAKRSEISKLQEQVQSKELQIQEMKKKERIYLAETENLKKDMMRVMEIQQETYKNSEEGQMEELKAETEKLKDEGKKLQDVIDKLEDKVKELNEELEMEYRSKIEQAEKYLGFHETELAKVKMEAERALKEKENEWRAKLEYTLKECDEIKSLYMDMRNSKNEQTAQLEEEKLRSTLLAKQKEQLEAFTKDIEASINQIKDENKQLKMEKELKEIQLLQHVEELGTTEKKSIPALEAELERLRVELVELPRKQTKELETLKNELDTAKLRLIELEKKLKKEFQQEISNIVKENGTLKQQIKLKDLKIKEYETSNMKDNKEMSTMTNPEEDSEMDIASLKASFKKKLDEEVSEVEKKLLTQHKVELAASEERIKNITVRYYSEQMEELERRYKKELVTLVSRERQTIEALKTTIGQQEEQLKELRKEKNGSDKFEALQRKVEEERNKVVETMNQWAHQVETMKAKMSEDEKKIDELAKCLKNEKKIVEKYKRKLDMNKKKLEQEKIDNIRKMKSHVDNIMSSIDKVEERAAEKLLKVEQEYSLKEKKLREKYENRKLNFNS